MCGLSQDRSNGGLLKAVTIIRFPLKRIRIFINHWNNCQLLKTSWNCFVRLLSYCDRHGLDFAENNFSPERNLEQAIDYHISFLS